MSQAVNIKRKGHEQCLLVTSGWLCAAGGLTRLKNFCGQPYSDLASQRLAEKVLFGPQTAKYGPTHICKLRVTSRGSSSTSTPGWNADLTQNDLDAPPSSTSSDEPCKIDPRLLAGATLPSVGPSICDATAVVDLTKLDPETTYSPDSLVPSKECRDGSIGQPEKRQQDLGHLSVAPVQPICDGPELEDDQFLVERLLKKRIRRFGRRRVVQYLVKWKGYTEEENTWEEAVNIHEVLIEGV